LEYAGSWGIKEFADAFVQLLGLVAPSATGMSGELDPSLKDAAQA
jgi:hypothetical protein